LSRRCISKRGNGWIANQLTAACGWEKISRDLIHDPPCKFGKCREILTKCREAVSVARLKTVKSQQLGWGSPYFNSREAILLEQGSETSAAGPVKRSREFFK